MAYELKIDIAQQNCVCVYVVCVGDMRRRKKMGILGKWEKHLSKYFSIFWFTEPGNSIANSKT